MNVKWKNRVICLIRPNNYIMCERLGNFWSLHWYLYSPKRLRCFTSDYRVRMFLCFPYYGAVAKNYMCTGDEKNEIEDETSQALAIYLIHSLCGVHYEDNAAMLQSQHSAITLFANAVECGEFLWCNRCCFYQLLLFVLFLLTIIILDDNKTLFLLIR